MQVTHMPQIATAMNLERTAHEMGMVSRRWGVRGGVKLAILVGLLQASQQGK